MKIETKEIKTEKKSESKGHKIKSYVFGDDILFDVPAEYLCGDEPKNVSTLIDTDDGLKIDACFTFENCATGSLIDFDPFVYGEGSNANILAITYALFISFISIMFN